MGSYPTYERNREMAIAYLEGGVTYAELGRRYKIHGCRVTQIVQKQKRRIYWAMRYAEQHHAEGQLQAPEPEAADIGEGVEWTPEAQYTEFELIRKHR